MKVATEISIETHSEPESISSTLKFKIVSMVSSPILCVCVCITINTVLMFNANVDVDTNTNVTLYKPSENSAYFFILNSSKDQR